MFNIVIFHSENEINLPEIQQECQKQNWIPVACTEIEKKSVIFFFNDIKIARDFLKRNFNKKILVGLVVLNNEDTKNIKENYRIEELNWPKKISNIKFEVIELKDNPSLMVNKGI